MEYELFDTAKNYGGRIILKDAIHYTLPIPVFWPYSVNETHPVLAGMIIELRWEDSLLVAVTDEFNEDPEFYDLAAELSDVKGRTQDSNLVIEHGILRAARICPIAAIPLGMELNTNCKLCRGTGIFIECPQACDGSHILDLRWTCRCISETTPTDTQAPATLGYFV